MIHTCMHKTSGARSGSPQLMNIFVCVRVCHVLLGWGGGSPGKVPMSLNNYSVKTWTVERASDLVGLACMHISKH